MKLHLERKISIAKPAASVYGIISDLNYWNTWSPWVHMEPTCNTKITGKHGIGQSQTWEGEVIGSGKMTVEHLESDGLVKMKLEFYKPWASVSSVTFKIINVDPNHSEVTWIMDGSLPIFMIFFKKMMLANLQSDFDRGLKMLKEFAETGSVPSRSTFLGIQAQEEFQIVGKTTSCEIADIATCMHRDFSEMMGLLQKHELTPPIKSMAVTHEFNVVNSTCRYTAAFYYHSDQQVKVPPGFISEKYEAHDAIVVDHFGAYRFLGNPWGMAMAHQRSKKYKALKKVPIYEVYVTMPDGRPEKDVHTQIFVPIKKGH